MNVNVKYNIIYLITKNDLQDKKISERSKLDNIIKNDYKFYTNYNNIIINTILQKEFKNSNTIKEFKKIMNKNSIQTEYNYNISIYSLIDILKQRDIEEIENLYKLNDELKKNLLNIENIHNIITIENCYISYIKKFLIKDKIYKNILFNTDYNKPIYYLIKEYILLFNNE